MARYWVGPWEWKSGGALQGWHAPAGTQALIDLRSIPNCAAQVSPQGFGLFVTQNAVNLGSNYENFGTDPVATLPQNALNRWASMLAFPRSVAATNLTDLVFETMTVQSDPIGDDRVCPLGVGSDRHFQVNIGANVLRRRFSMDAFAGPLVDQIKRQYRRIRQSSLDGEMPADHYRKVLGAWVNKFQVPYRALEPGDLPDESPLAPTTTIAESFTDANGQPLGPDLTWDIVSGTWQIFTNKAQKTASADTFEFARADSALSSDDHYAETEITNSGADSSFGYAIARVPNDDAVTFYSVTRDASNCYGEKRVAGTPTTLITAGHTGATPQVIKVQIDGSTLKVYTDDIERGSTTDSGISGNFYCGIADYTSDTRLEYFEAADLAAGGGPIIHELGPDGVSGSSRWTLKPA